MITVLPASLKPEQFNAYPPEAKKLILKYLSALNPIPLSFLPSLLREVIEYDFKFPAERQAVDNELANLSSLSAAERKQWFKGFEAIRLSSQLENLDWVNSPAQFVEQLAAHLWSTHQLDAFRNAATDYAERLRAVAPPQSPPVARLGIAIIGQGVNSDPGPLFRKLRPHGTYFSNVKSENGVATLLGAVASRAKAHPAPYGHWYVDGGREAAYDPALTFVSYHALEPVREALSGRLRSEIERPGMGPEALRTMMAQMRPADLGLGKSGDVVMDRFQIKILTEGSGTQIFSTTFAQWAAREALRRAQPLTLLVRFAPRQRQKPMNEMLAAGRDAAEPDFLGSLVDADFGAYYNWLNQQRLPGAEGASFLAWFEDHSQAVAIGPSITRGVSSESPTDLRELLSRLVEANELPESRASAWAGNSLKVRGRTV